MQHVEMPGLFYFGEAMRKKTEVLIIGGGATGTGIARDLAMRGVPCILVERHDINAGASGGNHGLLHSGARYVDSDPHSATECKRENDLIKKIAPHCIDNTGGLFVAVEGDDESYIADFPSLCSKSNVPFRTLTCEEARFSEPVLSDKIIAAYEVDDASIDPFMLSLDNMAHACSLGAELMCHTEVAGFILEHGRISSTVLVNKHSGKEITIEAEQVVNAAGAWAGTITAKAGITLGMICSKGTLLVTGSRMTKRVINRLRKATDGDILVPGGTVSIIGTTSERMKTADDISPEIDDVDLILKEGAKMVPDLEHTRYIRAYSGVRPLVLSGDAADDRSVSRGVLLRDHSEDGLDNFSTITGGKLTTFRLMAEKVSDLVCRKMGVDKHCMTDVIPLPQSSSGRWTEPGLTPKLWMKEHEPGDLLFCECEMVSGRVVDSIVSGLREINEPVSLTATGLRSRVGKGPCQGSFCGPRITAYMYDKRYLNSDQGFSDLKQFINERWRGQHSISWDVNIVRAELNEAVQCGLFGLELQDG